MHRIQLTLARGARGACVAGVRAMHTTTAAAPMELNYITIAPADDKAVAEAEPFVVMHGMLGNCNNWRGPGRMLADQTGRKVHCIDMRNHGASKWSDVMTFEAMANDVIAFIESDVVEHDSAIVLGHSLGGKAAMMAALRQPSLVNRLIVADIAPVDYNTSGKRKAVSHSLSYIQYMIDMPADVMADLGAADRYLQEKGVDLKGIRQFLLTNLRRNTAAKTAEWRANLAVLERNIANGELVGFETDGHDTCDVPSLIMTGGTSPYVKMYRDAPAFQKHFPHHDHVCIKKAGHWLHAEKPAEFVRLIVDWLDAEEHHANTRSA